VQHFEMDTSARLFWLVVGLILFSSCQTERDKEIVRKSVTDITYPCESIPPEAHDTVSVGATLFNLKLLSFDEFNVDSTEVRTAYFVSKEAIENKPLSHDLFRLLRVRYGVHEIMIFKDCEIVRIFHSSLLTMEMEVELNSNRLFYTDRSPIE
jgi:hypothetical protein